MMGKYLSMGAGATLAAILMIYGLAGFTDIEPGEVGLLIKKLGAGQGMQQETMDTGLHWVEPFMYDVAVYDTRLHQYDEGIREVEASTKDGQPVRVDVSLEIGLLDKGVPYLHETVGRNYYEQVVYPATRAAIRNSTSTQLSDQVYTGEGRAAIQDMITRTLQERFEERGILVNANLRDISFMNQQFVRTLEEKAQAAQRVIIEERNAEAAAQTAIKVANQAEGEKQKKIKEAEAEAERLRLEGIGERQQKEEQAKGILAIAKAQAEGTRLQVLAYGKGETYASVKWAENLGPNVKVWGVPTGSPGTGALMDLNGILQGAFKGGTTQ